ncbi:MAG TPA: hypothetical protein VFG06_00625 [Thermodesulfovibrionales bacterium]|jgi:hypothetical protein|nr:hypothetical protein [Thermodesulfovibrionales bacterium]
METVKINRDYRRLNEIMSVMAFKEYKQNTIVGRMVEQHGTIKALDDTFVIIESEFDLNRSWHDNWKTMVVERGIEIHPDINGETRVSSPKIACEIAGFYEISSFCEKHHLEQSLENYVGVACRVFPEARMRLSITTDPEIENAVKIKLSIDIDTDTDSLFDLDRKFFEAVRIIVPEKDREYFVKSYRIQSE